MMALREDNDGYYVLGIDENGERSEKRYPQCTSKAEAQGAITREANLETVVPFGVALSGKTLCSDGKWVDD